MTRSSNLAAVPRTPLWIIEQQEHCVAPVSVGAPQAMGLISSYSVQDRVSLAALMDIGGDGIAAEFLGCLEPVEAIGEPVAFAVIKHLDWWQIDALFKSLCVFVDHGVIE
jgi:hypothetical protein